MILNTTFQKEILHKIEKDYKAIIEILSKFGEVKEEVDKIIVLKELESILPSIEQYINTAEPIEKFDYYYELLYSTFNIKNALALKGFRKSIEAGLLLDFRMTLDIFPNLFDTTLISLEFIQSDNGGSIYYSFNGDYKNSEQVNINELMSCLEQAFPKRVFILRYIWGDLRNLNQGVITQEITNIIVKKYIQLKIEKIVSDICMSEVFGSFLKKSFKLNPSIFIKNSKEDYFVDIEI